MKFGPDHSTALDYRRHRVRVLIRARIFDRANHEYQKLFADHVRLFGPRDDRTLYVSAHYADALLQNWKAYVQV